MPLKLVKPDGLDAALTGASGCSILTPHVTFIGG
jgi:hypothetical protein